MNGVERQIAQARARRDAARAALEKRLDMLKPARLRSRAVEAVRDQAFAALDTGLDVARESKTIIAGVIAALTLWFMRRPILAWLEQLVEADADQGE